MRNRGSIAALFAAILLICACGGEEAELRPEIAAHLAEYEGLIEVFEPRFDAARGNPPEFTRVANSYKQEAEAWMNKWQKVAPDLAEDEGKAIKARIDELNERAVAMLSGA